MSKTRIGECFEAVLLLATSSVLSWPLTLLVLDGVAALI